MKLEEKIIKWVRHKQPCDFDKIIEFQIPMNKDKQDDGVNLDDAITSCDLDCLHCSKKFMISMDQPVHGECFITAAEKNARDEGLLNLINAA